VEREDTGAGASFLDLEFLDLEFSGFRIIHRVSGMREFRFRGWIFTRIGVRDGFGFRFWLPRHFTRSEPAPLPS
jgi:hypothetical protein